MRNNNLSKIAVASASNAGRLIKTACEFKIVSASINPFINKVEPLLTKSQITSANPMPGAISTLPLI
jgi:hypothetical protein